MPPDGSIDGRVLVLFSNSQFTVVEALEEISAWPDREISSRALQLLSTIRQSEFCIALLVLKNVFGYSVVLCKVKQKKSIYLLKAVNIAQDIANELKCLIEKAEDFILKTPRLTSKQTNRCNIAAATDEEHFRVGIVRRLKAECYPERVINSAFKRKLQQINSNPVHTVKKCPVYLHIPWIGNVSMRFEK